MAGLTSQGLVIKRLEDVLTSLRSNATTLFQDLVPVGDTVDTSAGTALGRIIGITASDYADLWEAIQQVYAAFDPNSSAGLSLDNLVEISGLTRFSASPTTSYLSLYGDYLTTIPTASVVSSSSTGKRFDTQASVTLNATSAIKLRIGLSAVTNSTLYRFVFTDGVTTRTISYTSDGSATQSEILTGLKAAADGAASTLITTVVDTDALVIDCINPFSSYSWTLTGPLVFQKMGKLVDSECEEDGPNEQPSATIDTINTPVLGWDTVTNPLVATTGRDEETDEELRLRFHNSKYVLGSNLIESLYSDLNTVEGVEKVVILTNDTDSTDANGLPEHSYMAIVQGGLDADIGDAVWKNKPPGIAPQGNVTVSITDIQGLTQSVKFKRPTPTTLYVSMNITQLPDWSADGESLIQAALVDYVQSNFSIGDDVIYSRLYTPINSVAGFQVNTLTLGTSATPVGTSNIAIAYDHIASLEAVNIVITIT